MASSRAAVLWSSHVRPEQERYVVRTTYHDGVIVEVSFKRFKQAAREADKKSAEGHYVELLDNDPDYGW